MDIRPPKKRPPETKPLVTEESFVAEQPKERSFQGDGGNPRFTTKQKVSFVLFGVGSFLLALCISTLIWYSWAISPVSRVEQQTRLVVEPGDTAADISKKLSDHKLIRSQLGFNVYVQLNGKRAQLQAGGYVLSPSQDVASIVNHMVSGKTDEIDITILPGLTLTKLREQFKKYGYSDDEITEAYNASYSHPLLATRPAGADLEGYIYPETYKMGAGQPLKELLERSFGEMYDTLKEKKYLDEFAKRNLTIHQAITLASIVQKEVSNPTDQKQVAQVFYKRLSDGMMLGSDVTFIYAAQRTGVEPTVSLDSPYNTRKYPGLPPGPIANMNPSALDATAFPAPGMYLYFVAGDGADAGKTFYAFTEDEHNANVAAHCKQLCQ